LRGLRKQVSRFGVIDRLEQTRAWRLSSDFAPDIQKLDLRTDSDSGLRRLAKQLHEIAQDSPIHAASARPFQGAAIKSDSDIIAGMRHRAGDERRFTSF